MSRGVKQINKKDDPGKNEYRDLTAEEQRSAMHEGTNATIDMIMREVVQETPPQYPHPKTNAARTKYQAWLKKEEAKPEWKSLSDTDRKNRKKEELDEIRKKLNLDAIDTYEEWKMSEKDGKLADSGSVEMGFAFEKQAFGFYDPKSKNTDWAGDAFAKFEILYDGMVNWYQ